MYENKRWIMSQEIKFKILDNQKLLESISNEVLDTCPANMVKVVNEFRQRINTSITKLIEDQDQNSGDFMTEYEGDSDDDDEDIKVSPKKRKK